MARRRRLTACRAAIAVRRQLYNSWHDRRNLDDPLRERPVRFCRQGRIACRTTLQRNIDPLIHRAILGPIATGSFMPLAPARPLALTRRLARPSRKRRRPTHRPPLDILQPSRHLQKPRLKRGYSLSLCQNQIDQRSFVEFFQILALHPSTQPRAMNTTQGFSTKWLAKQVPARSAAEGSCRAAARSRYPRPPASEPGTCHCS